MRRKARKKAPVLEQYRAENPPDELLYYLGVRFTPNGGMTCGLRGIWEPHDQIHHIHCGQRRRPDIRSNLIGVSKEGHGGRHDGIRGEESRYTCLCLLAKWHKSLKIGNYLEFHHDDLMDAFGHLILPHVDCVTFADEWLETERRKLESLIRSMESE